MLLDKLDKLYRRLNNKCSQMKMSHLLMTLYIKAKKLQRVIDIKGAGFIASLFKPRG